MVRLNREFVVLLLLTPGDVLVMHHAEGALGTYFGESVLGWQLLPHCAFKAGQYPAEWPAAWAST